MVTREVEEGELDKSQWKVVPGDTFERDARPGKTAKRAFVGAGARVLFYPTLLYNVVRNKLQPEFRWWDQIDQFLLLGAVPFPKDVQRLKEVGVEAVVTLNEPYETLVPTSMYQDEGIKHLVIPTRDYLFAPSFDDIRQAVDFIHEHVKSGKTTYVHCKAGRGRSTTIVLCYLGFGCCGTMLKNIAAGKLCFLARVGKTMRSLVLLHSGRVACMELHLMVFRMKK